MRSFAVFLLLQDSEYVHATKEDMRFYPEDRMDMYKSTQSFALISLFTWSTR